MKSSQMFAVEISHSNFQAHLQMAEGLLTLRN